MDPVRASPEVVVPGSYGTTRFNALRHGVLSRYAVLPWEDEAEYQSLLSALVAEHVPEVRRRSTWSRNWPGSSGGNGECGWRRRRYSGKSFGTRQLTTTALSTSLARR